MLGVGRVAGVRGLATMFHGKVLAAEILAEVIPGNLSQFWAGVKVKQGVEALGARPSLVAIAVGNHPASKYLPQANER